MKAAILVAVLSPRYVQSDWCKREVQRFYDAAKQAGLDRVRHKSRIFKVEKYFVARNEHPEELRDQLGCQFFEQDPATGRSREFRVEFGSEAEQQFLLRVSDLAKEISDLLRELEKQTILENPTLLKAGSAEIEQIIKPSAPKKLVYLAETTSDLREARDNIRRELEERGFGVLPDQALPPNAIQLQERICEDLQRCQLAVHPIGKYYGLVPEAADESIVALQYQLTMQHRLKTALPCLLWMPPGLEAAEPRQQDLIQRLQTAHGDAEILQVSLEELKTVIQERLTAPIVQLSVLPSGDESTNQRVYLDYDEQDLEGEEIDELHSYLEQCFDEVLVPNFGSGEVKSLVDEGLKQCDALIIYHGQGNQLWLQRRLRALQKRVGYPQAKPLLATAVYIAAPLTTQKQAYTNSELQVIKQLEAFSPALLQPFLAQLQPGQQGVA